MDSVFIHRGIVIPKGTTPSNPLAIKNQNEPTDTEIKGRFILPSLPDQDSIDKARKRAAAWTERYTNRNPNLEPLVLSFEITRESFELLKGRVAIIYINGYEEPIQTFDTLLREAKEAEKVDPGITLNTNGLSENDIKLLGLIIGEKKSGGEFVYKPYDEYMKNKEGSIKENAIYLLR